MTISPNMLNQHEKDPARPRRGRLYVFAVVAAATFLVGIAFWRTPVIGYTARTTISRQPPLRTAGAADQANYPRPGQKDTLTGEEIGSTQFLRQAVSQSDLAELSAGPAGETLSDDQILDSIRNRLQVTSAAGTGAGETHIKIIYRHTNEDLAVKLVDRLARQYLALHKQSPPKDNHTQQITQAEQAAAAARRQVEHAKQRLDDFLKEHFEDLHRAQNVPPEQQSRPPERIALNPAWAEFSGQLSRLEARLTQLLVQRTEAHPEVRDVQWQIEQYQQRLQSTPRTIEPPESSQQPGTTLDGTDLEYRPPDVANAPAPHARLRKPPAVDANRQLYQRLIGQYEQAQQRHELAEQNQRRARQDRWSSAAPNYEIIEPARIVGRHGGTATPGSVWILGLAATLAGGIISWAARASGGSGTITSVVQAQSLLRLPIMGTISTTDGPMIPREGKARLHLTRYATLLCELILLAAVLIMVVWLMSGRTHSSQFTQNPFGTFSVAVQDVASWWF